MPKAVIQQPGSAGNLLSGVAGAFAGAIEGEKHNEQVRQFDETMEQDQQQFDADLAFRIDQLRTMEREGKLTREQQERLAQLEQRGLNTRQDKDISSTERRQVWGFEHESGENSKQRTFLSGENTKDRKLQDDMNVRNVRAENYRTKVMDDTDKRSYALRSAEIFDQRKKLDQVGQLISQYGEPGSATWNEPKAFEQYLVNTMPPGALTGANAVPPIGSQEYAQKYAEFQSLTRNYKTEVARNVEEVEQFTAAQARAQQTGKDPAAQSSDFNIGLLPRHIFDPKATPDPLTGLPPIKFTLPNGDPSPLAEYKDDIDNLELLLIDTAANDILSLQEQAQATGNREALMSQFEVDLRRSLAKMKLDPVTQRTLEDHFLTGANNILFTPVQAGGVPLRTPPDPTTGAGE